MLEMYDTQEFSKEVEQSEFDIFCCLRGNVYCLLLLNSQRRRQKNHNQ